MNSLSTCDATDAASLCYVVGWESLSAIKIGVASGMRRVKRWTSMGDGELLHLEGFGTWYDCAIREGQLSQAAAKWPPRWAYKREARPHLGCRTDGWTEFYAVERPHWDEFLDLLESVRKEDACHG